jgi:UDP-glucose 4-epimerase
MRVFISGIAGFLGSHLAERMLAMGHDIVGCDSLLGGELVNVPADAEFYQYDCRDFNAMAKVMRAVSWYTTVPLPPTKVFPCSRRR